MLLTKVRGLYEEFPFLTSVINPRILIERPGNIQVARVGTDLLEVELRSGSGEEKDKLMLFSETGERILPENEKKKRKWYQCDEGNDRSAAMLIGKTSESNLEKVTYIVHLNVHCWCQYEGGRGGYEVRLIVYKVPRGFVSLGSWLDAQTLLEQKSLSAAVEKIDEEGTDAVVRIRSLIRDSAILDKEGRCSVCRRKVAPSSTESPNQAERFCANCGACFFAPA